MRHPSETVTARLLLRLQNPDAGDLQENPPQYVATAPDGRRFEALDLPALARLYQTEEVGPGWQIATV